MVFLLSMHHLPQLYTWTHTSVTSHLILCLTLIKLKGLVTSKSSIAKWRNENRTRLLSRIQCICIQCVMKILMRPGIKEFHLLDLLSRRSTNRPGVERLHLLDLFDEIGLVVVTSRSSEGGRWWNFREVDEFVSVAQQDFLDRARLVRVRNKHLHTKYPPQGQFQLMESTELWKMC